MFTLGLPLITHEEVKLLRALAVGVIPRKGSFSCLAECTYSCWLSQGAFDSPRSIVERPADMVQLCPEFTNLELRPSLGRSVEALFHAQLQLSANRRK